MKAGNMKKFLSYFFPRDYLFYITNPERSNDFHYNKKACREINQNRSLQKQRYDEYEDAELNEIKNIIASRPGKLFLNTLMLSGLTTGTMLFTCYILSADWTAYAAFSIIFPSVAYIIYNVLDRSSYVIYLHYKMEGGKKVFYDGLLDSLYELSGADKTWHVERISYNKRMNDYGGSKEIYDRHSVKIKKSAPGFIKTNVITWSLDLKDEVLYFFPDYIILKSRIKYSVMEYETFALEYFEKPYYETEADPDDAEKIGLAWLHPKKDGSADKRFRNNPEISIMLYAELKIISSAGNIFHLQISNFKRAYMFYKFISQHSMRHSEQRYRKPAESKRKKQSRRTTHQDENSSGHQYTRIKVNLKEEIARAHSVLGLKAGAPADEIRAAYLILAKKYHPDLVSDKKQIREFEEKMKEINKAYDRLKR
jgi:DnaJ-domain-containing protein 1